MVTIIVIVIIVGVLLYFVNTVIPMDSKIKNLLNLLVVIFLVLWILQMTGLIGSFHLK